MLQLAHSHVAYHAYKEDMTHIIPRKRLDPSIYRKAIESLVIVCADAVPINRQKKTFYLCKRRRKPNPGWWWIGGRLFAGELPEEAIQRHFRRETSLRLTQKRFTLISLNRYFWKDREQRPQNIGCDGLVYTFIIEPSRIELGIIAKHLDPREYDAKHGLQEFDYKRLKQEKVNSAILDLYKEVF